MILNQFFVKADADCTQAVLDECKGSGRLDKDGIDRMLALPVGAAIPTILENESFLTDEQKNTELADAKWSVRSQLP